MQQIVLGDVIETVKKELSKKAEANLINIDYVTDNNMCLRAIINFKNCMGEIIVSHPEFAPYNVFQIEVLAYGNDGFNQVFYWGDDETSTMKDVVSRLKEGLEIGINY